MRTDGPSRHNNILYTGVTFGPPSGRASIDVYDQGVYGYDVVGISATDYAVVYPYFKQSSGRFGNISARL